ncbi:MAG: hypothetical protein ABEJ95_01700 [Candidatus Nanohalobium sp.]
MVDHLDGTVDEVKENIRQAEDVDYEELLRKEEEGQNRKTVVEFLEQKIGEEVEEEIGEQEEVEEELVEEIEEDTQGGFLSGFTGQQILAGGALFGLVLGLIVGAMAMPGSSSISQSEASQKVETLLTAGGQLTEDQVSISVEKRSSMYYMNVTAQTVVNGTQRTQSQGYYMSTDGEVMFPEVINSPFGSQPVKIDVDQALERAQSSQTQQSGSQSGNQTGNQPE